jgi:hypothetical protein
MPWSGSEGFNDPASGEASGCWGESGSSIPSHMLEQEAHRFGLREREFFARAIGSPQQTQIVRLIIPKTKLTPVL